MLDVLGIEGNEKKVVSQISDATQKAHAIFYVTKTPNPPQKGEENKEGTIEKIQKQLGSQTEVWTIFNKPILSPRALKDGLINESEQESLKTLDEKMKGVLDKHYMGHKIVSTQIAFYGLAQALIPETDFYEKRQKFLENFKAEELLNKSYFIQLGRFISEELIENSCAKIIESNCNKALKVIEELKKVIQNKIEKGINIMIKEIQEHQQEAYHNLDRSTDTFVANLKNSACNEINRFESDFSKEMYTQIERGIEDEEFEEIFKNECEQRIEKLGENIERRFEKDVEQFRRSIEKDIKQFEDRIKGSLENLKYISINSGFIGSDFNCNIDSGINKLGLGASIGDLLLLGVLNIWNPLGWIELGLGILLGSIGIIKSVRNFFDSDYKKSQQKKAVDNALKQVCEKTSEDVRVKLEIAKKDRFRKIEKLKADLNGSFNHYERMKRLLKEAHERLGYISNDINLIASKQGACNE